MPSQDMKLTSINAMSYYDLAIQSLNHGCTSDSLAYIDMAISLSTEKPLFVIHKIKLLYSSDLKDKCIELTLQQLHYLYINCSLQEFCELLGYYHSLTNCTNFELAQLLLANNIPSILAFEYTNLLEDESLNFHSKALEYKKSSDFQSCLECCQIALKLHPQSIALLHLQADCYAYLENYHSAITLYEQILGIYPLTSEIAYPLAISYMHTNNLPKAISYFKHFLQTMPSHVATLSHLGDCYFKSKDYIHALDMFNRLIDIEPLIPTYYLKVGEIYQVMNRKYLSQKYYKRANNLKNTNFSSCNLSAFSKSKLFKVTLAVLAVVLLQFGFFKIGLIPPYIYDINIHVKDTTIPVNGFTDFTVSYNYFPSYSKMPSYTVASTNPEIADTIEGLDSLNALSPGTCSFEIKINNRSKSYFTINVVEDILP